MPAFPKNALCISDEVERIKNHFGDRLNSECYVVGNGPSCAEVRLSPEEISHSVIFRANWFFLEEEKRFGERVDGFFWSVDNQGLREQLQEIQRRNEYSIDAFFQPFQSSDSRESVVAPHAVALMPNFDHWAMIATDPTLARFMMGRPLPTQGMQMIAFAATLGFRRINIAGIDLYQNLASRYAWNVPDPVKAHLKAKDYSGGYEDKHSLDIDLHFLRAILQRYKVELIGISEMPLLAPFLSSVTRKSSFSETPRQSVGKHTYVTLADGQYVVGCMALARSLARFTSTQLLVLHTDPYTPRVLRHLPNVITRQVEPIDNPHEHGQERFKGAFTKLRIFELLEYDRITFIDADCVVLKDIDELFERSGFLAAPDWGIEIQRGFNSGLLSFSPNAQLRDRVFSSITVNDSDDGGDQGLLNSTLFSDVTLLPPEYNTLKRLPIHHPNLININDVKVLHFAGIKPWELAKTQPQFLALEKLWCQFLEKDDWEHLFWIEKTQDRKKTVVAKTALTEEDKQRRFDERLQAYDPLRRMVVRWADRLLPAVITKPIDRTLKRLGIL
jgi:hypothetical protein